MFRSCKIVPAFILIMASRCATGLPSYFSSDGLPDPVEIAKSYGYPAETHTVTTSDGYILTMHRVLSPNVHQWQSSPEPFILQHGLGSTSVQWVLLGPIQSVAFMLADNGFDVWMTNSRGTVYSRKHTHLQPDTSEFWDFSWHEHGIIDMPTMIDYILNKTKHKKVWYAGHSMGTTMSYVMCSLLPEYNQKIHHAFSMAPSAYMSHIRATVRTSAPFVRAIEYGKPALNGHLDTDYLLPQIGKDLGCRKATWKVLCAIAMNHVFGPNPGSNVTVLLLGMKYLPDSISLRQAMHYAQLMNKDFTFRMFDYYEQNMEKYKSAEPPRYPVEKITVPSTFFYSKNDYFAEMIDVETFAKNLPNVKLYMISEPLFNHLDYVTSTNADEMVYKPMLKIIQEERNRGRGRGRG